MDFSKFKTPDWLMIGGAVATLILGLVLDWAKVSEGGFTVTGNNAFDYFFTGGLAWLLTVAVGALALLLATGSLSSSSTPWPLVLLGGAGLALLLMLLRLIIGAGSESGIDLDRNTGMYITFLTVLITAVGAFLNFTASGGNVKDLTDRSKLRQAFDRPDDGGTTTTPPPPPHGGDDMPPPPPPA